MASDKQIVPTHTRIPDKALNIYGGSFYISAEELDPFFALFYDNIFLKNNKEYLTEKQLEKGGPILVDFDFRYNYEVETRQHTDDHIQDMVLLYLEELKEFFKFVENVQFSVFIMEKPHVNRLEDKTLTKDGIHMVIGLQMDSILQVVLRNKILEKLPQVWADFPLENSWESVLDEGISKGKTNWQMFGCQKPGNERYELTQHFIVQYDPADGEFMIEQQRVLDFNLSKNLFKLSAQYPDNPKFELLPKMQEYYNELISAGASKSKAALPKSKAKVRLLVESDDDVSEEDGEIDLNKITNKDILKRAMDRILAGLAVSEFHIKETHEYTQTLPAKYYEPGSHLLSRLVAFALKDTDERLFLSWVMLRSKASDFDFATIPSLLQEWKKNMKSDKTDGVTRRSIMFWSKQDAPEEFERVKNSNVDKYVEDTLASPTDYDFAMVLYYLFKDKYVCVDMTNRPVWYRFKGHRWEPDKGDSLRLCISREMYNIYGSKSATCTVDYYSTGDDQEKIDAIKKRSSYILNISVKLKNTSSKNNIMKEAAAIFYDRYFIKNMDANKWLMCFNNGVIDFKNKEFRNGYPQDYITKSTGIDYVPFVDGAVATTDTNKENMQMEAKAIREFMKQLFPVESLNRYMWDHLASCLIGINKNQTFNIYRGDGSNGKSKMTDLMSYALGDYKGTVPITLISEKRNGIGGTSSEVMQLKGLRYAVMQEPSKDTPLNEGIMKELTGGDPIQARALYMESETFIPQFKLCVCTNSLFEIKSNDNGTWRRIRICDFMSTFVDKIDTSENAPAHQFLKDKDLEDKLREWAPTFASMLVKRAFETDGEVVDCDVVLASSNKYRQGQDVISAFTNELVIKTGVSTDRIKKKELHEQFKMWFQETQGTRKQPKGSELDEFMDKKFGKCNKTTGWSGVRIFYNQEEVEDDLNE